MKKIKVIKYLIVFLVGIASLTSCMEYLDKTPEATVTEKDIFGTYISFQGYINDMYAHIINPLGSFYGNHLNWGGSRTGGCPVNYLAIYAGPSNIFAGGGTAINGYERGIWSGGWYSIRKANMALEKLPLLENATQEEKNLIEGQAYFFRAWYHGEIIACYGGMPYIDRVIGPDEDMKYDRLSYHESIERIIEDLDKAIALLPEDWDNTVVGQARIGANHGRVTKGAALGYKQKQLLYAASPLMNGASGNTYTYNIDYAQRSAAAGWELIQIARKGVYSLVPWENYKDNFYNLLAQTVWTDEFIWARSANYQSGGGLYTSVISEQFIPISLSDNQQIYGANQAFVDKFEMADGTRYKIEYDQDDNKRWQNRDPRFDFNFVVDREKVGDHPNSVAKLYISSDIDSRPNIGNRIPYLLGKYWPYNVNKFDMQWSNMRVITPKLRLAEVYLSYAEAVTVAYGADRKAPGADLTAVDAVNIVRARAGMPPVTAAAEGYGSFLDLVRNERQVELAYEDHDWFDKRRWYIAHLPEEDPFAFTDLEFDKDWTYFNRKLYQTNFWETKHYWLAIKRDQTLLYPGIYQNPGW